MNISSSRQFFIIAAIILLALAIAIAFIAGASSDDDVVVATPTDDARTCGESCQQVTVISGTNYAIQTDTSQTATAWATP